MQHNNVLLTMFYAAVVQVPTIVFSLIGLQSSSFFSLLLSKGCSNSTDCGKLKLRQASIKAQNPCNILNHSKRAKNRPFPSSSQPPFQSVAKCEVFVMKISFHSY